MQNEKDYFNLKSEEINSNGFKFGVTIMLLLAFIPVIMGILGIKRIYLDSAPCWLINVYLWIGICNVLSAIGIYFFKKIAVFAYIFFVVLLYIFFLLAYGMELFDSIFTLFFFIGIGLFVIIPRWKYFH